MMSQAVHIHGITNAPTLSQTLWDRRTLQEECEPRYQEFTELHAISCSVEHLKVYWLTDVVSVAPILLSDL